MEEVETSLTAELILSRSRKRRERRQPTATRGENSEVKRKKKTLHSVFVEALFKRIILRVGTFSGCRTVMVTAICYLSVALNLQALTTMFCRCPSVKSRGRNYVLFFYSRQSETQMEVSEDWFRDKFLSSLG